MNLLDAILPRATAQFAAGVGFEDLPPAAVPAPVTSAGVSQVTDLITDWQQSRVTASAGMQIPAVRRAVHVIAGTISTFLFSLWEGGSRVDLADRPEQRWLSQPDTDMALTRQLRLTLTDAIWYDRSVWQVMDRWAGSNLPARVRRVHPDRVSIVPDPVDPDTIQSLVVLSGGPRPVPESNLIYFDWAGTGGLRRFGWDILDLYLALQTAAVGYAKAPHPKAILKNHGADLTEAEIDKLLERWEAARTTRSVGYLNDVVDYDTVGWNAQELQLTEAREYAALEVARLFGLPARTLDAPTGDSMTYANVTDARGDVLEALRPWMTPVEQTLSLNDYTRPAAAGRWVPRGSTVKFDADAYTRDQPAVRMQTWQTAIASGVLTVDEARHWEPLASRSPKG